ncbi:hypothetical protein H9M94_00935 [Mycoplasma sp. Pen4]|uniref:aromatic motif membrane protein n=1 Tax=Mycoplasma sp. Pen4 TaxID=640330 RepID=UPI0016540A57|nr:aromatic motif membrane protein [Mycoplasma sp. Pen4]QNM93825.1 hypothetical protein H9M94_00935 [Mycoplasma sp. Pen4]
MAIKKTMKKVLVGVGFSYAALGIGAIIASQLKTNNHTTPTDFNFEINNETEEHKVSNQWKNFLNQSAISQILNDVFPNEYDRRKYIKSQMELGEKYLSEVQNAYRYTNNISQSLVNSRMFWNRRLPFTVKHGNEVIDTLTSQNWLWFLFNISKFNLIQDNEEDLSTHTTGEFDRLNLVHNTLYNPFQNIDSNTFIDSFKSISTDGETNYYLLTKDGFIILLTNGSRYDYETNGYVAVQKINTYFHSFPKILKASNINDVFDLRKYGDLFATLGLDTSRTTETTKILFIDNLGGTRLRYTPVYVNDKNEKDMKNN